MGDDSLTLEVLKQIRDELKGVRVEIGEVRDETRAVRTDLGSRIDRSNERLDRMAHEQIRLATAIVGLEGRMGDVVAELREVRTELKSNGAELVKLNARIDNVLTGAVGATVKDTAARVDKLEERMSAVERR